MKNFIEIEKILNEGEQDVFEDNPKLGAVLRLLTSSDFRVIDQNNDDLVDGRFYLNGGVNSIDYVNGEITILVDTTD